jgi:hypothetical protein
MQIRLLTLCCGLTSPGSWCCGAGGNLAEPIQIADPRFFELQTVFLRTFTPSFQIKGAFLFTFDPIYPHTGARSAISYMRSFPILSSSRTGVAVQVVPKTQVRQNGQSVPNLLPIQPRAQAVQPIEVQESRWPYNFA